MASQHSFELQPSDWQNLFSVDIPKTYDYTERDEEFAKELTDISGGGQGIDVHVHGSGGILKKIMDARDDEFGNLPMVIRNDDNRPDKAIVDIVDDIHTINGQLHTMKTDVDFEINKVLELIGEIDGVDVSSEKKYGFGEKLERYKKLKRSSDTAIEKYNQQMNNHIVSLTTNMAILAGAIGIVYMSAKKN